MRQRRLPLRLLLVAALLAAAPFVALVGIYQSELSELGGLPSPPSRAALPRLTQLAVWAEAGERPAKFQVEPAWPWTPVLDLVLIRESHEHSRAGWIAADTVAGLWITRRGPVSAGPWHVRRMALTVWLSRHWTASQLTQSLADQLCFGRGARGVRNASQAFFAKPVEALSPGELAVLAGLLRSPHRFNPDGHPIAALKRRNRLLRNWGETGLIAAQVAASEAAKPLGMTATQARCSDPRE